MITFEKIRWKNFLSTGNTFTEVTLNGARSHLIIGANGAGKSTMLDALCFGLFNKPFRKISISQLVNSINEKELVVEIEFSIGSVHYKVKRGRKPNVFEIYRNGKLLDQDAATKDSQKYLEHSVLKLNFKSFTQVVILGSSTFVPFMQLGASVRREVIEDILDIQIFSRMNNILKDKVRDVRENQIEAEGKLTKEKAVLTLEEQYFEERKKEKGKRIGEIDARMYECHDEIEILSRKAKDLGEVKAKYDEMKDMRVKISHNLDKAKSDLKLYWENDTCPTCNQEIQDKTQMISNAQEREKKFIEGLKVITDALNRGHKQVKQLQGYADEISQINYELKSLQQEQNILLQQEQNYSKTDLDKYRDSVDKLAQEVATINEESDNLKVVGSLLRDTGIKSKIISKFIPLINQKINKYLQSMDFFVNFTIDEEFKEVIKSRYRDEFSYASFSEGEKQKIDLSVLFTWREIAKMKNSAATNLLILDEVFDSSLDDSSTDELLKILKALDKTVNLFVISHKGELLLDKFDKTLKFEKTNDFSKLAAS
jgi:DNA repair exonuclease SbcCD ATPase subunit